MASFSSKTKYFCVLNLFVESENNRKTPIFLFQEGGEVRRREMTHSKEKNSSLFRLSPKILRPLLAQEAIGKLMG